MLVRVLRGIGQALLQFALPAHCQKCGQALLPWGRGPLPSGWCLCCLANLVDRAREPRFRVEGVDGRSLLWFEDEAAHLVRQVKDGAHGGLLRCLACQWTVSPLSLAGGGLLVPVPTHPHRRRERGGDPVEELCALWSKAWSLEWRRLLERRPGRKQRGLGAGERRRNLQGQYGLRGRQSLCALPPLVLVDDVVTTGATLQLCRHELERAGGRVAGYVSLACAPTPRLRLDALQDRETGCDVG